MKSRKRDRSPDKEKRSRKERHDSEGHQKEDESPKRRPKATDFMDDDNERGDRSPEKDKRSRKSRSRSLDKDKRSRKSRSRSPEKDKRSRKSRSRSPDKDKRSRKSRSRSPDKDKRSRKSRSRSPDKNKRSRKSRSRSPDKGKRSRKEKHGSKRHRKENESPKRRPKATDFMDDDNERWEEKNEKSAEAVAVAPAKKPVDPFLTRAGGAYIPPAKLKMMQAQMADKGSEQYQRMNWERIKKKIHGSVNKVNVANVVNITRELLQDNVIRGKGLLSRSIIQAQSFSPTFSHVYAALVGIINSKFPNIGELILRRLVIQFKRSFRRNDKPTCVTVCKFIAHLTNQRVAHEALVLEMLVLLMEKPTDDSIEVAITLLKECGDMLSKISPSGTHAVFESLRTILTDCDSLDVRTQYMIEVMMTIRKEKFKGYPAIIDELDLIDEDDQISHLVELVPEDGKPLNPELELNIFKFDPEFEKNEAMYEEIRKEIIGDPGETTDEEAGDEAGSDEDAQQAPETQTQTIIDYTEQDLVAFRRRVYLTIQSSLDFQEAAHKLIKNELKPKMESELCHMIVDCCAQQRTYERFFGLLSERFCKLRKEFQESFEKIARDIYNAIHRFEIVKLRNVSKLIAHLLSSDAISWEVLSEIKLTEEDTSSASRIYLKIVFQELAEIMGVVKLYERLHDPTMLHHFEGLFPRDHPKNTRFAINFFSLIGLAGLTVDLREFLAKKSKKEIKEEEEGEESSSSNESSDDSSSDSSSGSDSDSSSSSSASSEKVKKKRRKKD